MIIRSQKGVWCGAVGVTLAIVSFGVAIYLWFPAETQEPIDLFIDFQQYHYGVPPDEFDYDATGPHGPVLTAGRPFWRTYVDLFAPSPKFVIIQASTLAKPDHYPIALLRDVEADDLMFLAQVKPMGGKMAKSAGLIWRAQDKDNYYAVLADALHDQLHLLKMVRGQPHELAVVPIEIDVEFERREPSPTWGWYTLRVETVGPDIRVWFQDEKALAVTDETFTGPGRVGLITHADSVAIFDDLHVQVGRSFVTLTPRAAPRQWPYR